MASKVLRIITVAALGLLLLATGGCASLDEAQRRLIYRPTPAGAAEFKAQLPGDERYFVQDKASAGLVEMWWLPAPNAQAPTLLYLHGTFRNLYQNGPKLDALRAAGFSILAVDYRGWGRSQALVPSQQTIMADAQLAWGELVRRQGQASKRVVYGHSMGSAVAVELVSGLNGTQDVAGLVLESAFTSFADVARSAGWFSGLLARVTDERFDSASRIAKTRVPLLMLHGTADKTIPIALGRKLFDTAQEPKLWVSITDGNHSDLQAVDPGAYVAAFVRFGGIAGLSF